MLSVPDYFHEAKDFPPILVLDIPGFPTRRMNSPGTTTEDPELTGWLRDNGADEDTISRVSRDVPLFYIVMCLLCPRYLRHGGQTHC